MAEGVAEESGLDRGGEETERAHPGRGWDKICPSRTGPNDVPPPARPTCHPFHQLEIMPSEHNPIDE